MVVTRLVNCLSCPAECIPIPWKGATSDVAVSSLRIIHLSWEYCESDALSGNLSEAFSIICQSNLCQLLLSYPRDMQSVQFVFYSQSILLATQLESISSAQAQHFGPHISGALVEQRIPPIMRRLPELKGELWSTCKSSPATFSFRVYHPSYCFTLCKGIFYIKIAFVIVSQPWGKTSGTLST